MMRWVLDWVADAALGWRAWRHIRYVRRRVVPLVGLRWKDIDWQWTGYRRPEAGSSSMRNIIEALRRDREAQAVCEKINSKQRGAA